MVGAIIITFLSGSVLGILLYALLVAVDRFEYIPVDSMEIYCSMNPTDAGVVAEMLETIGYDDAARRVRNAAERKK